MQFYLEALWKSADIRWLRERRKDGGRGSKYFLGLMLLISLAYALVFSYEFTRDFSRLTERVVEAAPNLSFEKKDGKIVANGIDQPLTFDAEVEGQKFFVYINTATSSAAVSAKSFSESKKDTFVVVVTEDKVDMTDTKGGDSYAITAAELPENASVSYGKTVSNIHEFVQTNRFFAIMASAFAVIMFIFYTLAELVYLAIMVGIVALIARAKHMPWGFGELFSVGMFAVTLSLLLEDVLPLLGLEIPWVGTIVFILLLLGVVFYKPDQIVSDNIETKEEAGEQPPSSLST